MQRRPNAQLFRGHHTSHARRECGRRWSNWTCKPGLTPERSDFLRRKAKKESPEVCRSGGEATIGAEHFEDLLLSEDTAQPGNRLLISVLKNALDRVDGVRAGIEFFKIRIPEQWP